MKLKFALILIVSAFVLIGCATPKILSPAIPAQPAITNAVTGIVTPAAAAVPAVITNLPNATVTAIVAQGTQAAPFVPPPYNGILLGVLGMLSAGATLVATIKNKQLGNMTGVATTMTQGIQSMGTAAAATKQAIAAMASANGNADKVEAHVNSVTGNA